MGESGEDTSSSENRRGSGSESAKSGSSSSKPTTPVVLFSPGLVASPSAFVTPHAAVTPTLNASAPGGSSTTKGLQAKLSVSTRPQLHLDISKPLPDKLSVASFSPNSKSSKVIREEATPFQSPVSVGPLQGSSQNQPPVLSSNVQLVTALCSNISLESPLENVLPQLSAEQNQNPEKPAEGRQTSSQGEDRTVPEMNPTMANHFGMPTPVPPCPSSQEAGLLRRQASFLIPALPLRVSLPMHFFPAGLWHLSPSSCSSSSICSSSPSSSCPTLCHYHLKGEAWFPSTLFQPVFPLTLPLLLVSPFAVSLFSLLFLCSAPFFCLVCVATYICVTKLIHYTPVNAFDFPLELLEM